MYPKVVLRIGFVVDSLPQVEEGRLSPPITTSPPKYTQKNHEMCTLWLFQHNPTLVIVDKLLVHGHSSESGLHRIAFHLEALDVKS